MKAFRRSLSWQRHGALPFVVCLLASPLAAQSGTGSGGVSVGLSASRNARLSVAVVSGGVVSLPSLTDGAINTFPTGVTLRTRWTLQPLFTNGVALVAFFSSPGTALVNGTAAIPASRVRARLNSDAFQPVSGNAIGGVGTAGGSLALFTVDFGFLNLFNTSGDRTDQLQLQLDLVGAPRTVAGDYVGTLNIRAVAL